MEYGLIGEKLGHSFSQQIHQRLADYDYQLCPLSPQEFGAFMEARAFQGVNVTIPYKEQVIPYLDELDPRARAIGAVNTVVNKNGRLVGYNTDYEGFSDLAARHGIYFKGKAVLILGSGGTCKTVMSVAAAQGAREIQVVSRTGRLNYDNCGSQKQVEILINTSPAGMYPQNGECLVNLCDFPRLEAVLDVIFNPFKTRLVLEAQERGIRAAGGLEMLIGQAKGAAQRFTGAAIHDGVIDTIYRELRAGLGNLVLVGMPGAGKTTLGRLLAQRLEKSFVDLDALVEERAGMPIPQIFRELGEESFRDLESQIAWEQGKEGGKVIATGGGIVKRPQNRQALRQNGVVLWIDRPLEQLAVGGDRPLSQSAQALADMAQERIPLYKAWSDTRVGNSTSTDEAARRAVFLYLELCGR